MWVVDNLEEEFQGENEILEGEEIQHVNIQGVN